MRRLLILLAALLLAGCAPRAPWRQEAYVFGTRVELLIVSADDTAAQRAAGRVLREFDRMHRAFHAWQPSEVSALNAAIAEDRALEVSPELAAYIREAQALSAAGDHLFDPGIGRLIALWGFHSDEAPGRVPAPEAVRALVAQKPSLAALRVDGNRVSSSNRSVALDFGGYLKGVALDHAAALLREEGITNALINIGGNVMALGSKQGTPWRIGIQHPRPQKVGGTPLATLELKDGEAIGTSGDYHRYFEADGRRYCHLLDPRSGYPATASQAVTVLIPPGAASGMRSDALSKPLFIAGDGWPAMARRLGVGNVLRVAADGRVQATASMAKRLSMDSPDLKLELVE